MTFRDLLLPEFDNEMGTTRKILGVLPEQIPDYKPHAKSTSLSQLAGHIAQLPSQAVRIIELEEFNVDPTKIVRFMPATRQEALDRLEQTVKDGRAAIAGASDERLMGPWTFSVMGQKMLTLPRVQVLRMQVYSHIIHHRAQLGVYLRLLEIPLPGSYGPSADDMSMFAGKK